MDNFAPPSKTPQHGKLNLVITFLLGLAGITLAMIGGESLLVATGIALVVVAFIILVVIRPLHSFSILLLATMTVYSYSYLSRASGNGISEGNLNLIDLAWIGYIVGYCVKILASREFLVHNARRGPGRSIRFPPEIYAMMPYIILSAVLPILGTVRDGLPLSFTIIGLRFLLWGVLACCAYSLARTYGVSRVTRIIVQVLVAVAISHLTYALIQSLVSMGYASVETLFLERFSGLVTEARWIEGRRITGLLANPNNYGILGAVLLINAAILYLRNYQPVAYPIVLALSGTFALAFSGSRSALLGLAVAVLVVAPSFLRHGAYPSALRFTKLVSTIVVLVATIGLLIPDQLLNRFGAFGRILSGGVAAEVNAQGRVVFWQQHWQNMSDNHPFGTWVSPIYDLDLAVDNYYVLSAVQGTPVFTFMLVLFIIAVVRLGRKTENFIRSKSSPVAPLLLIGTVGVLTGSAVGTGSFSHIYIVTLFFPLIGITLALWFESRRKA